MAYYALDRYDIQSLRNQLQTEIFHVQHRDAGVWLALIDTAFDYEGKALNWFNTDIWPVYHQGKLAHFGAVSPRLLALTNTDAGRLNNELTRLLHHCQGRPMLSFLRSSYLPKALCEAWQNILEIETDDSQTFLLRFADTRITPVVADLSKSDAWGRLSNSVSQWLCIDRNGCLQSLQVGTEPPASIDATKRLVQLGDDELAKLLVLGQPDALANVIHEHFPELLPDDEGAAIHEKLSAICFLADRHDIKQFSDLMALSVAFLINDTMLTSNKFFGWLEQKPWLSIGMEQALVDYLDEES